MDTFKNSAEKIAQQVACFDLDEQEIQAVTFCNLVDPSEVLSTEFCALPFVLWPESVWQPVRRLKRAVWARRQSLDWFSDASWLDEGDEQTLLLAAAFHLSSFASSARLSRLLLDVRELLYALPPKDFDPFLLKFKHTLSSSNPPQVQMKASLALMDEAFIDEKNWFDSCDRACAFFEKKELDALIFQPFSHLDSDQDSHKRL